MYTNPYPCQILTQVQFSCRIKQTFSQTFVGRVAQSVQRLVTGWTFRGSNTGGGLDFPHLSRPALGPIQPIVQWVPGLSRV